MDTLTNSKKHIKHHVKHAGVDILAGILIGVFYKPKTPVGYAIKGAMAGFIVYQLMHDEGAEESTSQTTQTTVI